MTTVIHRTMEWKILLPRNVVVLNAGLCQKGSNINQHEYDTKQAGAELGKAQPKLKLRLRQNDSMPKGFSFIGKLTNVMKVHH